MYLFQSLYAFYRCLYSYSCSGFLLMQFLFFCCVVLFERSFSYSKTCEQVFCMIFYPPKNVQSQHPTIPFHYFCWVMSGLKFQLIREDLILKRCLETLKKAGQTHLNLKGAGAAPAALSTVQALRQADRPLRGLHYIGISKQ